MPSNLEIKFDGAVRAAAREASALGYFQHNFLSMLASYGGVALAKKLVVNGELQSGLQRLAGMGRLDLSIEHLVARTLEFAPLFDKAVRDAAEWRLSQLESGPKRRPPR